MRPALNRMKQGSGRRVISIMRRDYRVRALIMVAFGKSGASGATETTEQQRI